MQSRWARLRIFTIAFALGALCCSLATASSAETDMYDGHLRFTFIPYLWFPTINGTLNFTAPGNLGSGGGGGGGGNLPTLPSGTTVGVTVGPNDYLTHLNFAFLGYLEARKGNWSVFTDVITMDLSSQNSDVTTFNVGNGPVHLDPTFNSSTTAAFSTTIATLAGSYTVLHRNMTTLDVFAGAQLVSANATVNWSLNGPRGQFPQSGTLSAGQELVAGVAGIKGSIQLGGADSRWFIPYYFDVGGGGFTTYQAMAGIAYAFSWGDVALTYRHLYVDMGSGGMVQNLTLSGPMLGVGFHF
jgi:hypothetical protein